MSNYIPQKAFVLITYHVLILGNMNRLIHQRHTVYTIVLSISLPCHIRYIHKIYTWFIENFVMFVNYQILMFSCEIIYPYPSWLRHWHRGIRINVPVLLTHHEAIWRHRAWSTMVYVMTCCLMAPSHYLKQCWLITSAVSRQSHVSSFTWNAQDTYAW